MENVLPNQSNYITHPNQELQSGHGTAVDQSKGSEDVNKAEYSLTNTFSTSPTMIQGNIKERNTALTNTQFESYSNQEQLNQSVNTSKTQSAQENGQSSIASFQGPKFQPSHYTGGLATINTGRQENKQSNNGPFNQIENSSLTSMASSSQQVMSGLSASTPPISAMSSLSLSATNLKSQSGNFSRLSDSQQSSPVNYPVSSVPSAMKVAPSSASPSQHSSASQSRSQSGAGTPVLGQFTSAAGFVNSQPLASKSIIGPHNTNPENFSLYGQPGSIRHTQNIFAPSVPQQDAAQGVVQTAANTTSNINPSSYVQHSHVSNTQSSGLAKGSINEAPHSGSQNSVLAGSAVQLSASSQVSSSYTSASYIAPSSSLAFTTGTYIRPHFSQSTASGSQYRPSSMQIPATGPNSQVQGQFRPPVKDQGTHSPVIRGTAPSNITFPTGSQNPPPGTFGPPTSNFAHSSSNLAHSSSNLAHSSSNYGPPSNYGPSSGTHSAPPGTYGPPTGTRHLPPGTFGPQSGAQGPQSMPVGYQPRPQQLTGPQGPPFNQYPAPSGMQGPLPGNQVQSSGSYGPSPNIQGPTSYPQGSQLGYLSQSSGLPPAKGTTPAPGSNILNSNSQFGLPPMRAGPTSSPIMKSNYPTQPGLNSNPVGQMPNTQSTGPFVQGMPNQQMPPVAGAIAQVPSGPPVLNVGQQNIYAPAPEKNVFSTGPQLQNRYPQPIGNQSISSPQYQAQYPGQNAHSYKTNAMSVSKQGFDQLWGHHMVDLMQCRQVLPEYPEDPPEPKLQHQFAESSNCSPEIFRCTINRIPETNSLLQKSRLPFGILIHPFKDLNHLPVIQCATIVRCRACRTYINPFVYFVDSKRWKCNLCYRVNDLPEEFQYDPVSKSYGDPTRRPEIKSATIEFIAPGEYMLRPPQPAVYLFLLDVSQIARDSGYIQILCETLKANLDQLPGDARTQLGFICYDSSVHFYLMGDGLTRPREMTVIDIDDVFLPSPESLLVNLGEWRELVADLLEVLPRRHRGQGAPASALGAALQAAYKLISPTGGRITVFQTCLPNVGPGALSPREDPNARSSKDVQHLTPATDFYKRIALDCSGAQVAVDLFLINSQYSDLATLSGMSKFSGGTVYHIPLFKAARAWQADQLRRMLTRYLTRKLGLEAVMRVRCTRGIAIHTFHGNFFVRSTDLLSLPNVSPDAGFGMQLTIEESLTDLQQVCFQAALLYTSSKGERRIRVHTLCLPTASTLQDVLHSADTQCIIGLLSKMAVDRSVTAGLAEAREALMTVAVDALSAFRLAQNLPEGAHSSSLHAPPALRLLPLYLLALLKHKAFRTGVCTRLDDRVHAMCELKTLPLCQLVRAVYPDLYPVHELERHVRAQRLADDDDDADELCPDLPRLHLSAERVNANGAYLLDDGEQMIVYVCHAVDGEFLRQTFGVERHEQLPDEARALPRLDTVGSALLNAFVDRLNDDRPYASNILILRDNSPSRSQFTERLVDDRVESSFSYYEFLNQVKMQVK